MKSAYELAMERLQASDPSSATALTPAQKKQLADIDTRYKAKLAGREIFLKEKIIELLHQPEQAEELEKLREQLRRERTSLEEDREAEKNKVRKGT